MSRVPQLRLFAGPNGSGKSTAKSRVKPHQIGVYVNADDIEAGVRRDGKLRLAPFCVTADTIEVRDALAASELLRRAGLAEACAAITCVADVIDFGGVAVNSDHASALSDFLRAKLVAARESFSFETVTSHQSKVDQLRVARAAGFRTYLYYFATEDPAINFDRVRLRVARGGHGVPERKIVERYHESLALLREAIRHADRA